MTHDPVTRRTWSVKRDTGVRVRLTDEQRAALEVAARAENLTLSEYMRRRAIVAQGVERPGTPAVERLPSYHIDDLGNDPLRADNGALSR